MSEPEIRWTHRAQRDLQQTYDYLSERSPRGARRVIARLVRAVAILPGKPELGKRSEYGIEQPYRELVISHYKIFYRLKSHTIHVVRVWDTRRDPTDFFIPLS